MTTFISFARRRNQDSSIDSICTRCYQTIASGQSDSLLTRAEESHSCDPNGEYELQHPDALLEILTPAI